MSHLSLVSPQEWTEPSEQVGEVVGQVHQEPVVLLPHHPEEIVKEHPRGWMIPGDH